MKGDSGLSKAEREMIAVVVSVANECRYCIAAHSAALRKLTDAQAAQDAGLTGKGLLGKGDPAQVVYSFTLMERGDNVNYLRVQADNYDQPLDINEGAKLDLGSTAKLRTLTTYLDIVDQLHQRYEPMSRAELAKVSIDPKDRLSQWAVDYFKALPDSADRIAAATVAWSSGWIWAIRCTSSPASSSGPSSPKIAALRWSQYTVPVRRSRSQMPTDPASSATSNRASDAPTADCAAESSSSATTGPGASMLSRTKCALRLRSILCARLLRPHDSFLVIFPLPCSTTSVAAAASAST